MTQDGWAAQRQAWMEMEGWCKWPFTRAIGFLTTTTKKTHVLAVSQEGGDATSFGGWQQAVNQSPDRGMPKMVGEWLEERERERDLGRATARYQPRSG